MRLNIKKEKLENVNGLSKRNFEEEQELLKEFNMQRKGMKQFLKGNCPVCGKKMKHGIDSITKKRSKYIWECPCMKGVAMMVL